MPVILIEAAVGAAIVGTWFVTRWMGNGRPCPTILAPFFDNPLTDALSATSMIVERAGVVNGMRVLDAGCGPGRLTIPRARRVGIAGEVVALDVQEGMLVRVRSNAAKNGLTNIRTLLGALEADAPVLVAVTESFGTALMFTLNFRRSA